VTQCREQAGADAFFTGSSVSKQKSSRTDQTEIVEGLDNRYAVVPASGIGAGRDDRKRVMEMDNVGSAAAD